MTTDSGGVKEYAKDGYNAIFVQKLKDLWEHDMIERLWRDKKLMNTLITNGKKSAKKYDWHDIINRLELIYNLKQQ